MVGLPVIQSSVWIARMLPRSLVTCIVSVGTKYLFFIFYLHVASYFLFLFLFISFLRLPFFNVIILWFDNQIVALFIVFESRSIIFIAVIFTN